MNRITRYQYMLYLVLLEYIDFARVLIPRSSRQDRLSHNFLLQRNNLIMVHHITAMYASKAAEAGLIIRKRRLPNRRKEDIEHEDLCNMLARQIEEFVSITRCTHVY